jgi:hypothetical protein
MYQQIGKKIIIEWPCWAEFLTIDLKSFKCLLGSRKEQRKDEKNHKAKIYNGHTKEKHQITKEDSKYLRNKWYAKQPQNN